MLPRKPACDAVLFQVLCELPMSSEAWVLVTGANRGLGYATARSLVKAGESVIVGARSRAAGLLHRRPLKPDPCSRLDHCTHPAVSGSECTCCTSRQFNSGKLVSVCLSAS